MKYFMFLTLLIFISYILGFVRKLASFDWMDGRFTTAVKGFSILTVVWAHSGAKLGVGGIQFIAGIGVALFLICSGYGLEMSYQKNGLKGFWKKRLLGACLPFWIVELIGLLLTKSFTIKKYVMDTFFLKPATSYGWFMGYIVFCYLIFYISKRLIAEKKLSATLLITAFIVWFVIDSCFFSYPDMPFLRARQMISFPCGALIAQHKSDIEKYLTKTKSILICAEGGIICLLSMAVTQLEAVKQLPYLLSNLMALLTCFPMAIGLLALGKSYGEVFQNRMLMAIGAISYEIYLVHVFTLPMINSNILNIISFVFLTVAEAFILHISMKMKDNLIRG